MVNDLKRKHLYYYRFTKPMPDIEDCCCNGWSIKRVRVIKGIIMKSFYICIIMLVVCAGTDSCRKSPSVIVDPNNPLSGSWYYTERYYSIGTPGEWHPVAPGQRIELHGDGRFSSNFQPFSSAVSYRVLDGVHLSLIKQAGQDSVLYSYSLRGDTLELTPYPMCFEGCADRFLR
jgi:hypothetical protein